MKVRIWVLSILVIVPSFFAKAELSTSILPSGINSPSVRFGMVSNLDQTYTEKGSLAQAVDVRSIEFDARRIAILEPRVQQLVNLFNQLGSFNLGNDIHMGNLRIDSTPQIQYTGLIFARGLSERWTVGGGIPVISYKNKITVGQSRNNLDFYRQLAQGIQDPGPQAQLIAGVDELAAQNIPALFHDELRRKGYNDLSDQNATFLGDLQLSSLYKLNTRLPLEAVFRVNLNLPSGPAFNPDNLAALNQFGYTYIEPQIIAGYPLQPKLKFTALLGTRLYLPDQITARVPKNEDDLLPAADQKELVQRSTGIKLTEAAQLSYDLTETWSFFGISEWSQKSEDKFQGNGGGRYDLLGEGTSTDSMVVTAGATFSSVQSYMKRKKGIPAIVTAQISDTIAGRNLERQLVQEINAIIFF